MTLKDGYRFGGFSGTPPSEPNLRYPPPPPPPPPPPGVVVVGSVIRPLNFCLSSSLCLSRLWVLLGHLSIYHCVRSHCVVAAQWYKKNYLELLVSNTSRNVKCAQSSCTWDSGTQKWHGGCIVTATCL